MFLMIRKIMFLMIKDKKNKTIVLIIKSLVPPLITSKLFQVESKVAVDYHACIPSRYGH